MAEGSEDDPTSKPHSRPASRSSPSALAARTNHDSITATQHSHSPANLPPQKNESSRRALAPESQPMTKTSSSSSMPSAMTTHAADTVGPSPYGTRSRNKAGNARPNYAEDREMDTEYDWAAAKKSQASGGAVPSGQAQAQAGDSDRSTGVNTRRSSNTAPASATSKAGPPANPKDGIPGTLSFSLNAEAIASPAPTTSKKRKAPGGGVVASAASQPSGQAASHGASRRATTTVSAARHRETNMLTFENCQGYLKDGKLKADDGTILGINDHVYLICEPPGEPYYLARIMEFLHSKNSQGQNTDHNLPIEYLKVNWYYRPRDIQRKVNDTRVIFASMHSDTCPLTSLRGKCQILHRNEVTDTEEYRKTKDCFWYDKMFDRYIHRYYEVIPTSQVINVPARVKKVLDERWKYVLVEQGRGKELTSAIKTCKRCVGYCASNDSVDCAMCKNTYHMNCVRPPLLKKPARGFAWSCGPCSRKQERKLEARNTPLVSERAIEGDDEELPDEDDDDHAGMGNPAEGDTSGDTSMQNSGPRPATAEQIAQAKQWPYRYLGIHCQVEDALDYDDRIYPRASSRLGPKHQANIHVWHGRPVELVKPAGVRRKYMKSGSHKKDAKSTKESVAALDAEKTTREKRPKWVMDEPPGYVRRGEDHPPGDNSATAKLQFRMPQVGETSSRGLDDSSHNKSTDESREKLIDEYMTRAKGVAKSLRVPEYSTNFLDKALELFYAHQYEIEPALDRLRKMDRRKDLKEPDLTKEEIRKFEEGVTKYGSELRNVSRHVGKSQKHGEIVRYYYMWKKTDRGKQIWGHHESRKGKKQSKQLDSKLVDDVADDVDDSAFDNAKAAARKRGFECKFCFTRKSPQWRRAPGTAPGTTVLADPHPKSTKDKGTYLMVALCQRCAGLWRKYGIQWENIDEVAKKVANGGGRAWKRRVDEELLIELVTANEANSIGMSSAAAAAAASVGVEVPSGLTIHPSQEGPKKKQKLAPESQITPIATQNTNVEPPKRKIIEKPPEPPLVPETPKIKILPCAVCFQMEPMAEQHLTCRHCRLTVHRNCYGVAEGRSGSRWTCDTCSNDSTALVSTTYECVLCPVTHTEHELMEPPRVTHKKKSDREREKERLERQMVAEATNLHRRKQIDQGRPFEPREPLKRTAGNNWVHVLCAIWNPELRFASAKLLDSVEGIGSIPSARYGETCKLCKTDRGVCISCNQCATPFHVTCAQQHGYTLGFDVAPVKGSRKDLTNVVTLGPETGIMSPVAFCREHSAKTVHPMHELVENSSLNALQLFARTYKQVDLTTTGTVRKAALIHSSVRSATNVSNPHVGASHRNSSNSTANAGAATCSLSAPTTRSSRVSPTSATVKSEEVDGDGDRIVHLKDATVSVPVGKSCRLCGTDTSPKWHQEDAHSLTQPRSPRTAKMTIDLTESRAQPMVSNSSHHANAEVISMLEPGGSRSSAAQQMESLGTYDTVHKDHDFGGKFSARRTTSAVDPTKAEASTANDSAEASRPAYMCHKCHLRKLRNPTPPRGMSPIPDAVKPEPREIHERESSPPIALPAWPPGPPVPARDPYRGWPSQPGPHYAGRPRLSNGVSRSPPANIAPLPPHFVEPPSAYHMPSYRHPPPHHDPPMQHLANGVPPPYQHPRNSVGHMVTGSYVPPPPASAHSSRARHVHLPPALRSPPMLDHNSQGPNGVPHAAENPFAIPFQSRSPPRPQYHGLYESPRGNYERAATPPDRIGRNGGWSTSDGHMANGASASPSLRNLLH